MTQGSFPLVLIVDDQPDRVRSLLQFPAVASPQTPVVQIVHPDEVTDHHLSVADLVLVDYRLDGWTQMLAQPTSLRPRNGLALVEVLRSNLYEMGGAPTAFALISADFSQLAGGMPLERRPAVVARLNNLEWAFDKLLFPEEGARRVGSLARAVGSLPASWEPGESATVDGQASRLLGLGDVPWRTRAWEEVRACFPPFHELVDQQHGMAVLRWLLHRILPYPTFLIDEYYLASRLRVEPSGIRRFLQSDLPLAQKLADAAFGGVLSEFEGGRWWRAGVEQILWDVTGGEPYDPLILESATSTDGVATLDHEHQPVVCFDEDLRPLEDLCDVSQTVRLQPDDWPAYAELPRASIADLRDDPDDARRPLVVPSDESELASE